VIGLVLLLKVWVERTPMGEWIELVTYDFLQLQLASSTSHEASSVVVLDLSALRGASTGPGSEAPVTPRSNLRDLITAVLEQKPRAVGVDVDFSPVKGTFSSPQDPLFFDFCLRKRATTGIPLYLGVYRTLLEWPDRWLGKAAYQPLAAALAVPKAPGTLEEQDLNQGVRWMPLWIQGESPVPCPSLGAALAGRFPVDKHPAVPAALGWAVELFAEPHVSAGFHDREFLVDYSRLPMLRATSLRTIDPDTVREEGHRFTGKLVLLGDGDEEGSELYVVPGRRRLVPGVFLHATAADTLDQSPLYELRPAGRLIADAGLSLLVLSIVIGAGVYARRRWNVELSEHRLHQLATWVVALATTVTGAILVHRTRLMWNDFLFVVGALLIHQHVSLALERFWRWAGRAGRDAGSSLRMSPSGGEHGSPEP
jgi:CHASE2 domain-containing sensor protein